MFCLEEERGLCWKARVCSLLPKDSALLSRPLQHLPLSTEALAWLFLSSLMGSGNSLYSSTSVSCAVDSVQLSECQLHTDGLLGSGLEAGNVVFAGAPGLCPLCGHLSVFKVSLVSQHNEGEVSRIPGTGWDQNSSL